MRRQQTADLTTLLAAMNVPPTELQLQLFFILASLIVRHQPDGIARLTDADVADAADAMASTLEAADGGLIAQVPASTPNGEGLRRKFDEILAEIGKSGGARFARDTADVLRGIERGARHESAGIEAAEEAYLTVLRRLLPPPAEARADAPASPIIMP